MESTSSVPVELKHGGCIVHRQSTYWDLRATEGSLWRVHFKSKLEARYVEERFSSLEVAESHPFLGQYLEPWAQLFFSGTPTSSAALENKLAERVTASTGGWRTLDEYLNGGADLSKGSGLLMRAPVSLVNMAVTILSEMGMLASVFESSTPHGHPRALLMEKNVVVAQAFRFDQSAA